MCCKLLLAAFLCRKALSLRGSYAHAGKCFQQILYVGVNSTHAFFFLSRIETDRFRLSTALVRTLCERQRERKDATTVLRNNADKNDKT